MKLYGAPQCYTCKHLINADSKPPICKAFINGIPNNIFYESKEHFIPLPKQDNEIVYEKSTK